MVALRTKYEVGPCHQRAVATPPSQPSQHANTQPMCVCVHVSRTPCSVRHNEPITEAIPLPLSNLSYNCVDFSFQHAPKAYSRPAWPSLFPTLPRRFRYVSLRSTFLLFSPLDLRHERKPVMQSLRHRLNSFPSPPSPMFPELVQPSSVKLHATSQSPPPFQQLIVVPP